RGYAFLQMVLYPDKMERSDDFAARALSLLALSNHLSPDMPSLREEALISMNIGYKAHAQSLIGRLPVPSQEACDGIIDAYLKKDISRLSELKGESPGAMGYYFLTRLYRESGLFMEAKQHGTDLLLRLKDHYPSVVEMIYSADLGTARILTTLYPLHILLCMEYEVGSKDLNRLETIEERLKIFLGESSIGGKTSFTEFEALLSQWQPLPEGVTTGFLIASSQIKTIYRTLYSGAIYLRHNLLLNRLSSMDAAQNYVKSIFSGNETHPLAMSMLADVWSNLGKYNQAKALCEQIVNHPQTKANLVMKAYFCVDDIQFKLKIAPGVFKKLDSNPANQRRMGNLFQWLHNYDMAENFYKTSLEKDPYAFSTYLRLAKVTGDSEPVSKGLEKYSHNYSFLEKAGDYYKEFKDTNLKLKALDCYDKALNQVPSRQSLWRKKASLLKELGKYEKAQQTITTWLEQYGSNNLTTTMMRAQLAKLLLKMEKPDQALKILENDLESYQAGVMMTLGQIYEALDRKNDAWSMYEKAVDRYPNVNHVLSGTAAFLWRENQYAAAAGFISKGRQVNNPFSRWYFDDYMTNFSNALGNKVMESYKLVVESGAGNWERKALAYRFEEKKRPEISYLIMSGLSSPNRMQELENKIDQYKVLKNWKGKEAAQVILSPYFSPQLNGRISMVLFKEGLFDILLDEIKAPDDYPKNYKEFMWLMKLMAWIACEKPDSYHEELNRHYEKPASDYYHSIGSYLIGKISLHNLLALIKTPKQRCEFAYYIGYSFRMKNDFSTAANWYQICLETGLTNNGEYHWAADELFWWTHMGTRNRHKNLAQDISDYQKQEI
ncbi:MAG: tetratricopeptide repeat protein, partial [Desulfobacula sp.]|nr:tetratricopeptide repeat protein [Desulfobacula sp.]